MKKSKLFAFLALCAALAIGGYFAYLATEIQSRFASRKWSIPARVFSATTVLYPGQALSISDLKTMLERRRYREALSGSPRKGEYRVGRDDLEVSFRSFDFPGLSLPPRQVRFRFSQDRIAAMEESEEEIAFIELEPVEMARLFGPERESRLLVSIDKAPRHLVDAVLSIEDHRFHEHPGVDWWGIARALWADLRAGRVVQGGSTITQQLVKNYFLEPDRTLKRKIVEASMAVTMEALYSKDEILEMYLNEIYLGQRGEVAIHGIGEAALYYFGRNMEDLTLPESATLAGLIRAPSTTSPIRHPRAAKERRNVVLDRMRELGRISAEQCRAAQTAPLGVPSRRPELKTAPYFVDCVRRQLRELYDPGVLESGGHAVHTTLQPEMEAAAEEAVRQGLRQLEQEHPRLKEDSGSSPLQAAMVVVQPKTGAVLALVGGRSYGKSTFNRALDARRQPGSAIKPFVYLAALDEFTPATWLSDKRVVYNIDGQTWSPRNYDRQYQGRISFREALERSRNAATVHLAMATGLEKIIDLLRTTGIRSPLEPFPSLALGAFEVTPLELAGAYAALDNDGKRPFLMSLKDVVNEEGQAEQKRHMSLVSVTSPAKAFLVTNILEGVVLRGTARSARKAGIDFPCAGKTGTTSDYRDSWFVGYTPDLLALVWVGFDDNRSTRLSGASGALRLWTGFFNRIQHLMPKQDFRIPPGIAEKTICMDSRQLARPSCPRQLKEYFLESNTPRSPCTLHADGWWSSPIFE